MKKPHITFHQNEYGIFIAKVHGQLSWEPMLIAYGYGFSIHSAVSRAWERWKAQENSDIEFPWSTAHIGIRSEKYFDAQNSMNKLYADFMRQVDAHKKLKSEMKYCGGRD